MFELCGVNYEEVLEQGDSILVRVIASSSYRGFELSGLYCSCICLLSVIEKKTLYMRRNYILEDTTVLVNFSICIGKNRLVKRFAK